MVLELLALAGLPISVAVAEGIKHDSRQKRDADEQTHRMQDFHLDVYCSAKSRKRDQVHGKVVVLQDGKLLLATKDPKTNRPLPIQHPLQRRDSSSSPSPLPPPHPFTGFYLDYQPAKKTNTNKEMFTRLNQPPPMRGLVSTIPPTGRASPQRSQTLNWIYVDRLTFEVKYGSRAEAAGTADSETGGDPNGVNGHVLGPFDWTEDESGLTLEGWEGFVAVEEERDLWAVYYDRDDNGLRGKVYGRRVLQCSLERRVIEDDTDEEGSDDEGGVHDEDRGKKEDADWEEGMRRMGFK